MKKRKHWQKCASASSFMKLVHGWVWVHKTMAWGHRGQSRKKTRCRVVFDVFEKSYWRKREALQGGEVEPVLEEIREKEVGDRIVLGILKSWRYCITLDPWYLICNKILNYQNTNIEASFHQKWHHLKSLDFYSYKSIFQKLLPTHQIKRLTSYKWWIHQEMNSQIIHQNEFIITITVLWRTKGMKIKIFKLKE